MSLEIHQGFKRVITTSYVKADGTAGVVEGLPVWEVVPAGIADLVVAADGLSAELSWAGVGEAVLTITADGDLGAGVFPIVVSEAFSLVAPLGATAGTLSVGEEVAVVVVPAPTPATI